MRRSLPLLGVALLALTGLFVAFARAEEKKVGLDKLPKAVVDAVKAKFAGAKMVDASSEMEDGKLVYEVSITVGKTKMDVTVTPEGKITCVEKEIAAQDVPKEVAAALEAKYPKAKIELIEEVTKGADVSYEFVIVTADKKKLEVVFDPKGKFVKEEKKDEKKPEPKPKG